MVYYVTTMCGVLASPIFLLRSGSRSNVYVPGSGWQWSGGCHGGRLALKREPDAASALERFENFAAMSQRGWSYASEDLGSGIGPCTADGSHVLGDPRYSKTTFSQPREKNPVVCHCRHVPLYWRHVLYPVRSADHRTVECLKANRREARINNA